MCDVVTFFFFIISSHSTSYRHNNQSAVFCPFFLTNLPQSAVNDLAEIRHPRVVQPIRPNTPNCLQHAPTETGKSKISVCIPPKASHLPSGHHPFLPPRPCFAHPVHLLLYPISGYLCRPKPNPTHIQPSVSIVLGVCTCNHPHREHEMGKRMRREKKKKKLGGWK